MGLFDDFDFSFDSGGGFDAGGADDFGGFGGSGFDDFGLGDLSGAFNQGGFGDFQDFSGGDANFGLPPLPDVSTDPSAYMYELPHIPASAMPQLPGEPTGESYPGEPAGPPSGGTTGAGAPLPGGGQPTMMDKATDALAKAGTGALGYAKDNPLKTALGIGASAALAKGILSPNEQVKPQIPPEVQAAMARASARAAGMGGKAYGPDSVAAMAENRLKGLLSGRVDALPPAVRQWAEDAERQAQERAIRELGPGALTSTAGANLINNTKKMIGGVIGDETRRAEDATNQMFLGQAGYEQNARMAPFQADLGLLSGWSPYFGAENQAAMFNANQRAQGNRQLAQLGGQGLGLLAGNTFYRELLNDYYNRRAGRTA